MGPLLRISGRLGCLRAGFLLLLCSSLFSAYGQTTLQCTPTATNLTVHAEGLAEPTGDILLACSGGVPGAFSTNITLTYPVAITNRLSTSGIPDMTLTVDSGIGPMPGNSVPSLQAANVVVFNGVSFTVPGSGSVLIRISNIRISVNPSAVGQPITASISTSGLLLTSALVTVATPNTGLLATYANGGITCVGSPLPSTTNYANLLSTGTAFVSTRVTEGFGTAFSPKDPNSDGGTRILVSYSGFPAGARIFLPDYVAGNDALQPTAGGDLGLTASGGMYSPSPAGSLLLARVIGADANGAGGSPIGLAASIPVNTAFNSVTEVILTNGAGSAAYEVIDANQSTQETAQFPSFFGIPSSAGQNTVIANESVSLAPVSTVHTAAVGLPVPRFVSAPPPQDCQAVGDCGAAYYPVLSVGATSVQFAGSASGGIQTQRVTVNNTGGGYLQFGYSVAYTGTPGWLTVTNESGTTNHTTLRLDANPGVLPAGTYTATLTINAGNAGSVTLPVSFVVGPPQVIISSVTNAATLQPGPLVAGSLATIKGQNLAGKVVTVTFGGVPGNIIYSSATQINLQVPASIVSNTSTSVVVTADGNSSAPVTVQLATVAPGIFGVLNQDNSLNSAASPAAAGTFVQVFATGLYSGVTAGPVLVGFGSQAIVPAYVGGTGTGLQQVNAMLPLGARSGATPFAVCAEPPAGQVCSPNVTVYVK